MARSDQRAQRKTQFFEFTANSVGSIIAIVISLGGLGYTYLTSKENNEHDAIKTLYNTYYDISKTQLQIPEAMHVFVLPTAYDAVTSEVRKAVSSSSPADKAKYRISERAMADYLFSVFEATLYDYRSASSFHDTNRKKFEKETLDYFTGRLLRNPRLLYYWSNDGGGLSEEYDPRTVDYYNRYVLHDKDNPLKEKPDVIGPLAD